jgi:hypothetical protein
MGYRQLALARKRCENRPIEQPAELVLVSRETVFHGLGSKATSGMLPEVGGRVVILQVLITPNASHGHFAPLGSARKEVVELSSFVANGDLGLKKTVDGRAPVLLGKR